MNVEFTMPQLGLTMTEGTVTKWLKMVGDPIVVGEPLVEISTDKITSEIEATASGTVLEIRVPEGDTIPVKTVLAVIGKPSEKILSPLCDEPMQSKAEDEWVKASPLARKLARERGIDLAKLTGTGPSGRVVERDVLAAATESKPPVKPTPLAREIAAEHRLVLASVDEEQRIMKGEVLAALHQTPATATVPPRHDTSGGTTDFVGTPLSGMRKIISQRMSLSWQTVPHVHLTMETDMSEAIRLKEKLFRAGTKVSYTDIIVKCTAQALAEFRVINDRICDGRIIHNEEINIGVAVALDNGLVAPVIRNADQKSLCLLSAELAELSSKARQGKLLPDEYAGGSFTVSNLGMYGVDHFTPVINPPESAILGVCRLMERAVVVDSAVTVRSMMNLCLAFDHRLIDGATAAQFMCRLRQYVEQPLFLL